MGLPDAYVLHPYFDNVEDELWLKARVNRTLLIIEFYVECPKMWNSTLKKRVQNHFLSFELNTLYSSEAADELRNINFHLREQFKLSGEKAVSTFLNECAATRVNNYINSWQTALYTAIASDTWFCNGGFDFF